MERQLAFLGGDADFVLVAFHYLTYAAIALSLGGSVWLLCVAGKLPCRLFNRQLWHLALAEMGMSLLEPVLELYGHLMAHSVPEKYNLYSRTIIHYFLFMVCLLEAQIAACVAACALRSLRGAACLAAMLPWSWAIGLGLALLDMQTISVDEASLHRWTEIFGAAPVTAIFSGVCFFLVVALNAVAAISATCCALSPSRVASQALVRALVFPSIFLVTLCPAWLVYMSLVSRYVFVELAALSIYSNGWANAFAFGLLHSRYLCRWPCRRRSPQREGFGNMQFCHVRFGPTSMHSVSLRASATASVPVPYDGADGLWATFSAEDVGIAPPGQPAVSTQSAAAAATAAVERRV